MAIKSRRRNVKSSVGRRRHRRPIMKGGEGPEEKPKEQAGMLDPFTSMFAPAAAADGAKPAADPATEETKVATEDTKVAAEETKTDTEETKPDTDQSATKKRKHKYNRYAKKDNSCDTKKKKGRCKQWFKMRKNKLCAGVSP